MPTDPFERFKHKRELGSNEGYSLLGFRLTWGIPAWFFYDKEVSFNVKERQMPYLYGTS